MTTEEKINIVHSLNYEFIDDPYQITNWSQIHVYDSDGYKYKTSLCDLKRNKIPTKIYKKNIYLVNNLKNYFRLNAPECNFIEVNLDDIGKEVKFTCNNHLDKGLQSISIKEFQKKKVRNTKTLCYNCGKQIAGNKKSVSDEVIIKRCEELNLEYIGKEKMKRNGNLMILFICKKHKEKGIQKRQWDDLKNAKYSCYYCYPLHKKSKNECVAELNDISKLKNYTILDVVDYNNIKCMCNICGHLWTASLGNLKSGTACPHCKKSHGEQIIEQWLLNNQIIYFREYRFDNCKYKRSLPFDFYLPDYNMCIEYQGIQHYKPCTFNGISTEQSELNLKLQKEKDIIKKQYCLNNNIIFLEISYVDFENIHNILQDKINKIKIA